MSNVLERFRSISEMEFYTNAVKIRHEISHFLMNEKNIPKRWRSVYAYPTINLVQTMIDTIMDANEIYPYSVDLVAEKKTAFKVCEKYVDKIYERLQGAVMDVWWDTLHIEPGNPGYKDRVRIENKIAEIGKLLEFEERLLRGCKNNVRLLKRK